MSKDEASRFWKRVLQDEQYRARLAAAPSESELEALIRKEGFQVTADELKLSLADWEKTAAAGVELSEEEMETVAGGSVGGMGGSSLSLTNVFQLGITQFQATPQLFSYKGF